MANLAKIIVILGPTASGKTDLAISLAKKFKGEIISADSRQVYQEMNIATAKPAGKWHNIGAQKVFMVQGVPHYLMGIVSPAYEFGVAKFKDRAETIIKKIIKRGSVPFIVGGTGLYLDAITGSVAIPTPPPNKKLRARLQKLSVAELGAMLKVRDSAASQRVDLKNKRRVIRALEVAWQRPADSVERSPLATPRYNFLQIGLSWPQIELYRRIDKRVGQQFKLGLVNETKKLLKKYSPALPSMSGIGYREIMQYLNGEMTLSEARARLCHATHHYAKRQITWFKKNQRVKWVEKNSARQAAALIEKFLL